MLREHAAPRFSLSAGKKERESNLIRTGSHFIARTAIYQYLQVASELQLATTLRYVN